MSKLASITASATPCAYRLGKSTSAPEERDIQGLRRHAEGPNVTGPVIAAAHCSSFGSFFINLASVIALK